MLRKLAVFSLALAIVAIGLIFVAQNTKAGKNTLDQLRTIAFLPANSAPLGQVIMPENEADRSIVRYETFERLRAAAAASKSGTTRAIVGLNADFTPVGYLSARQVELQNDDIKHRQGDLLARLTSGRVNLVHRFEFMPFILVDADEVGLTQLENDSQVLTVEEDALAEPQLAQSSPLINAPATWAAGFDGTGWEIAILDTGVNKHHDFFGVGPPTKVVSEACYSNAAGGAGTSSLCPGGATSSTAVDSGLNCTGFSGCEHGTAVAGVGAGNNGTNASGIARGSNLIAIQVFRALTAAACGSPDPCTRSNTSDQIKALERVLFLTTPAGGSRKIAAVNMSLGGQPTFFTNAECDAANASTKTAIDNLRSVGVATVISSGNDGDKTGITAPACISSAVSVGSTVDAGDDVDGVTISSNSAPILSLLAPGETITTSTGLGNPSNVFTDTTGTSVAAPHVAGAFAVLRQARPDLPAATSVGTILSALQTTGKPVQDFRNGITKPRINLRAALAALGVGPTPTPTPSPVATPTPTPGPDRVVTGVLGTAPAGGTTGNLAARISRLGGGQTCDNNGNSFTNSPGAYIYNTHRFANTAAVPVCITVSLTVNVQGTAVTDLQVAAQLAPFVPSDLGITNRYLSDPGASSGQPPVVRTFKVTIPANASFDLVVFSTNVSPAGQGARYTLNVAGLPGSAGQTPTPTPTPTPSPSASPTRTPTPSPSPTSTPMIDIGDTSGAEDRPPPHDGRPEPDAGRPGNVPFNFIVTRSGNLDLVSTVHFSTVDGTATAADHDYEPVSGTLTFGVGESTQMITVIVDGDAKIEPDEAFTVHLDTPVEAFIEDADGLGTIVSDDFLSPPREGDINRTNPLVPGFGDTRLDGDDLIWYDRFANAQNCPQISTTEFQRMDTSPLATGGDGALGLDRSQLERFIDGRDAAGPGGGPVSPTVPFCAGLTGTEEAYPRVAPSDIGAMRTFRIGSVKASSDAAVELPIEADLTGDEVTAQFTLHFDPNLLTISDIAGANANPDVMAGNALPDGTRVIVNTSQVAAGDIGLVVYFNGSGSYPATTSAAGTTTLVTLRFNFASDVQPGSIALITFNDNVFTTKTSDAYGQPLAIGGGLAGGAVSILRDID